VQSSQPPTIEQLQDALHRTKAVRLVRAGPDEESRAKTEVIFLILTHKLLVAFVGISAAHSQLRDIVIGFQEMSRAAGVLRKCFSPYLESAPPDIEFTFSQLPVFPTGDAGIGFEISDMLPNDLKWLSDTNGRTWIKQLAQMKDSVQLLLGCLDNLFPPDGTSPFMPPGTSQKGRPTPIWHGYARLIFSLFRWLAKPSNSTIGRTRHSPSVIFIADALAMAGCQGVTVGAVERALRPSMAVTTEL